MDWKNEESDHSSVENFVWDEKNIPTKTKSEVSLSGSLGCNACSQGVQASFGSCKETRSYTSVFDRLELEAEIDSRDAVPLRRTSDAQTEPANPVDQELVPGFQTLSCRAIVQNPDILNFQGKRYSPNDLARYWKKDSRMWLWKSVRIRQRRNQPVSSNTVHENEDSQ